MIIKIISIIIMISNIFFLTAQAMRHKEISINSEESNTLHHACMHGDVQRVVDLLNAGKDQNSPDDNRKTPLHYAAAGGYLKIIKILCAKQIMINAIDGEGRTSLHYAAANGHKECIIKLLECGADHDIIDNDGAKAIDLALQNGYHDVEEELFGITPYLLGRNIDLMETIAGQYPCTIL